MSVANEIQEFPSAKMDYDQIQKKILASVPPCADDLEAHIKFAKIYRSRYLLIHKVLRNQYPSVRCRAQCVQLIENIAQRAAYRSHRRHYKRIATRSPGTGNSLIPSKSIKKVLEDKKAEVMEVNAYMQKGKQLCLANDELDKTRGDFECDLIEHLFGTSDDKDQQKTSMVELVEKFARKVGGVPDVDDRGAGSSSKKPVTIESNVFNSTASDAVQQMLQSKGIKKGAILQLRSDRENPFILDRQFEISYINEDGSIGIRRINSDGSITRDAVAVHIAMDNIFEKHMVVKQENRMKELVPMQPAFDKMDTIPRIVADIALYKLYQQHKVPEGLVIIQGAPKVRLLARSHIAAKKLVLVPWSQGVQTKRIESKADARVCVEVMTKPPTYFAVSTPNGLGKTIEVEFWRMNEDRKGVKNTNMKWSTKTEVVPWPVDIGRGVSVEVHITVAVNTKAIQPNQEIRVYTAPTGKKRKIMEASVDTLARDGADDE